MLLKIQTAVVLLLKAIAWVLFLPVLSNAQIFSDVRIEPRPYVFPEPYDDSVKDPIKKVMFITRIDLDRNLNSDTTYVYIYGKDKKKQTMIRYDKNKPADVYHFKYTGGNLVEWWEDSNIPKKATNTRVTNRFDKKGNKTYTRGTTISKKDTISWNFQSYQYDKQNRLVKKISNTNNSWISRDEYYYSNSKLVKHNLIINPKTAKYYSEVVFKYNKQGLLGEKWEFNVQDSNRLMNSYRFYTYQNGKLSEEKYINSATNEGEQTIVQYKYDENNRLKEMNITKGALYKKVFYHYESGKVKKINAETNAWNYLNGEFYIPLSNSITPSTKFPVYYEEQYAYDSRGNLIEKKLLLNGQVKKILDLKIEYY